METAGSVWDSVGHTPLIRIKSLSELTGCNIYGKAEFLNPGGSIKDRAAKGMIAAFEREGRLLPGGVIVEGSAGNTGIGLAVLAAERGYKAIITMPGNQAQEKYLMLQALGADVRVVPPCPFANEHHFYHQARRIAEELPHAVWADQFENLANAQIHYETTGPEIWKQLAGQVDVLVCSSGTGGTIGGTSSFLKERDKTIETVLCDPEGSGLFHYFHQGDFRSEGSSVTEGIGIMRLTANMARAQLDDAVRVTDQQMMDMMFFIAPRDGLFLGTSSALNLYGAYLMGKKYQNSGKNIVTFLCDHGSRYASKVLDTAWMEEKGFVPQPIR